MTEFDAIIVGAGHNGLTAGVELQRAGKKVLILEKTKGPGGQATTREIFEGYKHSVGAWALLIFREALIEYLEMDKEGFELIRPESSFTVFGEEGQPPFIGYTDPIDLANHLAEDHGFEALDGFNRLGSFFSHFKEMFEKYVHDKPPTLEQIIAEVPDAEARAAISKLSYGSAVEILRDFFPNATEHGCIQGSLCASAIDGTHMGPFTKGSGVSMAYHYTAGDTYDFKIPKGGIGTVSTSLLKVFERYGGEVRFRSPVESLIVEEGKVLGVRVKDGEEIRSRAVISTVDSKATFGSLCDRDVLPTDFANAVDDIEYANGYIQVHMTIRRLPTFTNHLAFVNGTVQSWLVAYIKGPEQLHRAWQQSRAGQVADDPAVYTYFPSQLDPSLAPGDGTHTCTMFSHYFPTDIPPGKLPEAKKLMVDRMTAAMERVIPDFRDLIVDQAVFTQQYFENVFNATEGDFSLGLMHPGQMFGDRPVPGWDGGHETPLENLFMAGAACHPGPGVTCIPGLNGARVVLEKLGGAKDQAAE
ncbi:MAG: NAD(P)/FAD-dependent oxidoreductase [Myxococcota bacterium]